MQQRPPLWAALLVVALLSGVVYSFARQSRRTIDDNHLVISYPAGSQSIAMNAALDTATLDPELRLQSPYIFEREPDRAEGRKGSRIEREAWYFFQRTYPGDTIPQGVRQEGYELLQRQLAARNPASVSGQTWQFAGPAPIEGENLRGVRVNASGRTTAVVIHPTDSNTIYIGAAQGGVWKSTNGGTSWTALTDDQPSLAVGSMTMDPNNPNVLYVGTGEPHSSADSYYGVGVLKSTDGGNTWTQLGEELFAGMGIANVVVDPSNSSTVYVAASAMTKSGPPRLADPGIYKSTDGGQNWNPVLTACSGGFCYSPSSLVIDPDNPGTLYTGYDQMAEISSNELGVYKTTNGGQNWDSAINGWLGDYPALRSEVAISQSDPNVLYVGVEVLAGNETVGILYKSTNGAGSWTFLQSHNETFGSYCGQQCSYDNVVAVHPTNPDVVLAGGQALYSGGIAGVDGTVFRTTNGGANWTKNEGTSLETTLHPDLHAIAFAPNNPDIVWLGHDGGVSRSTNGGATWENPNGNLGTLQFQGVALHPTNPNVLFGGMQDNAKAKTGGGLVWEGLDAGDGGFAAIDPFDPRYWYGTRFSASGAYMQFQRNDNTGSSPADDWPLKDNGIDVNDRVAFYAPLAVDPNEAGRVYWGTHRLYRSNDRGENWTTISPDLTRGETSRSVLSTFDIARGDSNVILVGTSDGNVQRTTNGGTNWTDLTKAPLPNRFVSDVAIHPTEHNTLFAVFNGFAANTPGEPGHVFKSTNGGSTWSNVSNGLPDLPVMTIVIDRDAPNTLYIGTDFGVYRSTDGGNNWAPFNQGLPLVAVFDLALNPDTDVLAAATHGRSIWRMSLAPQVPLQNPLYLPLTLRNPGGSQPPPATVTPGGPTPTRTPTRTATATPTRTATQGSSPTPTRTATRAASATPTPTPTQAPPPVGIQNGNFDQGRNGAWSEIEIVGSQAQQTTLIVNNGLPFPPRSGQYVGRLGNKDGVLHVLAQTFILPNQTPYLHFRYQSRSDEVCQFSGDFFQVIVNVGGTNNEPLPQSLLCKGSDSSGWTLAAVDLRPYAGQTIQLEFRTTTDGGATSTFFLDDVALSATAPDGQEPYPLPNGNFEAGRNNGWAESSDLNRNIVVNTSANPPVAPRSGQWLAWLGGGDGPIGGVSYSNLYQSYALPANGPLYLNLYYQVRTQEEPTSLCPSFGFDELNIWVNETEEATGYASCAEVTTWTPLSIDLSDYAGQLVTIHIRLESDESLVSDFLVDDVAISRTPIADPILSANILEEGETLNTLPPGTRPPTKP